MVKGPWTYSRIRYAVEFAIAGTEQHGYLSTAGRDVSIVRAGFIYGYFEVIVDIRIEGVVKRLLFQIGKALDNPIRTGAPQVVAEITFLRTIERHAWRKYFLGRFIIENRERGIVNIRLALSPPRRLPRGLDRRQQQRHKDPDDRNDDEQLDERKSSANLF